VQSRPHKDLRAKIIAQAGQHWLSLLTTRMWKFLS